MDSRPTVHVPIQIRDNIVLLRHLAYINAESTKIQCGWIAGTAWWELKLHLARCQWENACVANDLRKRLADFPGGKPDREISPNLIAIMEALAAAPDGPCFIQGLFGALKPYLVEKCKRQLEATDAIADSPTIDILHRAVEQEQRQIDKAQQLYAAWNVDDASRKQAEEWAHYIQLLLEQLGEPGPNEPSALPGLKPYVAFRPSPIALRDDRFETSFAQIAPLERIEDEDLAYEVNVVMMYFKEMQAVETVAACLYETKAMPWEFYYDTSRHCWDEARHCMLGQRRFEQLGFDIVKIKSMTGNYAVRQFLDPLYRYAHLTMVEEARSMKSKRQWVEQLELRGKTLTARLVEYDLADERNHVNNGFRWVPEILKARGDTRSMEEVVEAAKQQRLQAFELVRLDHPE